MSTGATTLDPSEVERTAAPQERPRGSRLRRVIGTTFAIQVGGGALAYATQVALARWMGDVQYGFYTYCVAWAALLATAAVGGIGGSAIRFVPVYLAQKSSGLLAGFVRVTRTTFGVGVALACAAGWALHATGALAAADEHVLICLAIVAPLAAIALNTQVARSLGRLVLAFAPERIARHALVLLAAGWLFSTRGELDARDALLVLLGVVVVVACAQGLLVGREMRSHTAGAAPDARWGEWMRVAGSLLAINVLTFLMIQSDVLMLGYFDAGRSVGIYSAAAKTVLLVQFGFNAINAVVAPRIAALHAGGRIDELQALARKSARGVFGYAAVVVVVFFLGGRGILGLFGESFVDAYSALLILAVGRLGASSFGLVMNLMNMTGNERASAFAFAAAAGTNLVLNALLIPSLGAQGAALATAVSTVGCHLLLWFLVRRRLGIDAFVLGRRPRSA